MRSNTIENAKLLKSGFKRTINFNKYQSKVTMQVPNPYLDFLIDSRFQGLNILFVLSFENTDNRNVNTKYYLRTVEIKDYNDQPVKNDLRTQDNIRKIAIGQRDNYTTGCLLDYIYFKQYYKMKAIDFSKEQALDADLKVIQQINFTGNLNRGEDVNVNAMIFLIIEGNQRNYFWNFFCKEL